MCSSQRAYASAPLGADSDCASASSAVSTFGASGLVMVCGLLGPEAYEAAAALDRNWITGVLNGGARTSHSDAASDAAGNGVTQTLSPLRQTDTSRHLTV